MAETSREIGFRMYEEGRLADSYQHLYGFATEGDLEAMGLLGSLMVLGVHRFESWSESEAWLKSVSNSQREQFYADIEADVQLGVTWLRRASEAGMWGATNNLSTYYFGLKGDEARSECCRLAELARKQFDAQST